MRAASTFNRASAVERGFSLVELLIAMLLGLIIVSGAASIYLASKRSLTEVEQVASLSENGRFALQLIASATRHVGFFGGPFPADVRPDGSLGDVTGDCTGDAAAYDTSNAMFALSAASANVVGCIDDALPGTEVLVIKGINPFPLYDADPDDPNAPVDGVISFPAGAWSTEQTYVVSNSENGVILDGADTAPDVREGGGIPLGAAWPYNLQIYYVRNAANVPTLSRKVLGWNGAAMEIQTQDLVQGVENMRFMFGFDSGVDGEMDTVANLTAVQAADRWNDVTSIQVFMLVRSDTQDFDYTNQKIYQLGDTTLPAFADNFRRILLHNSITLRNPRLLLRGES